MPDIQCALLKSFVNTRLEISVLADKKKLSNIIRYLTVFE